MKRRFFPWRVFWRTYLIFLSCALGSLTLALLAGVATLGFEFFSSELIRFAVLLFILLAVISLLAAYRIAEPFRGVLMKALRLSSKKQSLSLGDDDPDPFEEEPGEYFELEQALEKIRRKLKKRRIQLSHEREESQAVMSFLPAAVISIDRAERLKFFNSRFATLFLDSHQLRSPSGETDLKLIDISRDPELLSRFRQALEEGVVQTLQKRILTRMDQAGRYFSITLTPLREERSREVYGVLAIFHDISELKAAEMMRSQFVENASHELRTPLTSIKGFVATAKDDAEQGHYDQVPQFLQIISRSVDRLIELVNDMLTISSLEHHAGLNREWVDPKLLTMDVLERLSALASQKELMVKAHFNTEALLVDSRLVEQVLINLIGNAIKFIPEGRNIQISWDYTDNRKEVLLSVKDNGPGIEEQHLNRLFERFYRIDKSRSRDVGGTGLGLAIVKHVVQSHGGHVRVHSRLNEGTEFICSFPI